MMNEKYEGMEWADLPWLTPSVKAALSVVGGEHPLLLCASSILPMDFEMWGNPILNLERIVDGRGRLWVSCQSGALARIERIFRNWLHRTYTRWRIEYRGMDVLVYDSIDHRIGRASSEHGPGTAEVEALAIAILTAMEEG